MSTTWRRRIVYTVTTSTLAFCLLTAEFEDLLYLIIGVCVSRLIRALWSTRTFTIGIAHEGRLFTRCELCQDIEVILTDAGLRTTIGFALRHARQHITHKI